MKLKLKLSLLFSVLTLNCMAAGIKQLQENCLSPKKIYQYQVVINNLPSTSISLYTRDTTETVIVSSVQQMIRHQFELQKNLVSPLAIIMNYKGKSIRTQSIGMLQDFAHDNQFSDYQKALLATCATASLITYKGNLISKIVDLNSIYAIGKGVCTEMSEVLFDLASKLGLEARIVYSKGHTFVEVLIDGQYFILDATAYTGRNLYLAVE